MKERAIVVRGNLSDGFQFVGPFEDFDAALDSMEAQDGGWIATLYPPEVR